ARWVRVSVPPPALGSPALRRMALRHTEVPVNDTLTLPQANTLGPLAALVTSSRPQPNTGSTPGAPRSRAPPRIDCRTRSLLKYGNAAHTTAAAPDTSGAANEVPPPTYRPLFACEVASGSMNTTSPGAARQ